MEPVDLVPGDLVIRVVCDEGCTPVPAVFLERKMVTIDNIIYEECLFRTLEGVEAKLTLEGVRNLKLLKRIQT